jgi:hypothetical protein
MRAGAGSGSRSSSGSRWTRRSARRHCYPAAAPAHAGVSGGERAYRRGGGRTFFSRVFSAPSSFAAFFACRFRVFAVNCAGRRHGPGKEHRVRRERTLSWNRVSVSRSAGVWCTRSGRTLEVAHGAEEDWTSCGGPRVGLACGGLQAPARRVVSLSLLSFGVVYVLRMTLLHTLRYFPPLAIIIDGLRIVSYGAGVAAFAFVVLSLGALRSRRRGYAYVYAGQPAACSGSLN